MLVILVIIHPDGSYRSDRNILVNNNNNNNNNTFLISNFCHVLNVVCFLLGNSPASEFYMPTFQNTLSVPTA